MANAVWFVPLGLLAVLVLARLTRVRPALRPLLLPFVLTYVASTSLALIGSAGGNRHEWLALALAVPVVMLAVRATVIVLHVVFRRSQGVAAPAVLGSVASVLLYGIGVGVIANRWFGVELTPFLATSAVVGAVLGLALQDTLGNLFSGIALHTEAPFRVGDWVRFGDRDGRVEQVSWRATRLRTWYGDTLTIPNNEVARHSILNYSLPREPHSRVVQIGVNYQTPPNKVISVLAHTLEQVEGLRRDPRPAIRIIGYQDCSMLYEVRYFFDDYADFRRVEGDIFRLVRYHFRRHGIEIPYPVRNVFVRQMEAQTEAPEAVSRLERALRGIDLFRPLSDDELKVATQLFRLVHYAAGEKVIEEGSPGDSFFVIDHGEVNVSKSLQGASRPLARLMEGQFFGEMALLTGEARTATVVAHTDVDLFTIDKTGFEKILVANPSVAVDISTILSERREALSQAEGDITARFDPGTSRLDLKHKILGRIRNYFGL
ncbi:MAG TPA: mechanosensitive ion channel family protein [Candidatus Polarisedimenticolaceae bacterium]|nr:mechanosensitive ion channel family protein [Candidatus Polarisedimenticolaceae bacterium]